MEKRCLPKLDLNITNRCNYRCSHCAFNSGVWDLEECSVADYRKILTETRELGGQRIDLTGGEPTLRTDLDDIIQLAKEIGFKIELVTNGSLLTKSRIKELVNLGLDSVALSLDGAAYEQHSRIRGIDRSSFIKLLKRISLCVKLGLQTKINTLVTEANYRDLPRLIELAVAAGVHEHGLYYFTPVGRGKKATENSVEPKKWLKFIRNTLVKYTSYIKLSLEVAFIEKELSDPAQGCIALTEPYHLQILPDARVYPCAILASYELALANLHQLGVKEIWNNKTLWGEYGKKLKEEVWEKNGFCCVNFTNFEARTYLEDGYSFVCPLRKFSVEELLLDRPNGEERQ